MLRIFAIVFSMVSFAIANEIDNAFSFDTIPKQCRPVLKRNSVIKFKIAEDEYDITPFGFCMGYDCYALKGTAQSIFILSKNNFLYSYVKEIPIALYEKIEMETGGDVEIIRRLTRNKGAIQVNDPKKYITEKYLPSEVYEDSDVIYSLLNISRESKLSIYEEGDKYFHYPVFEGCMISEIKPIIRLKRSEQQIIIDGLRSGQCSLCGAPGVMELSNPDSSCYKHVVKINEIDKYIMRKGPYRVVDNAKVMFKRKVDKLYENTCTAKSIKTKP